MRVVALSVLCRHRVPCVGTWRAHHGLEASEEGVERAVLEHLAPRAKLLLQLDGRRGCAGGLQLADLLPHHVYERLSHRLWPQMPCHGLAILEPTKVRESVSRIRPDRRPGERRGENAVRAQRLGP